MSVTINKDGADTYFAPTNHARGGLWERFDPGAREGAVAQATRLVTREIGEEITDETVDDSISYRPDYAVFEQALHLLMNSDAIPNGGETAPHFAGVDSMETPPGPRKAEDPAALCAEAAAWLARPRRRIMLSRG